MPPFWPAFPLKWNAGRWGICIASFILARRHPFDRGGGLPAICAIIPQRRRRQSTEPLLLDLCFDLFLGARPKDISRTRGGGGWQANPHHYSIWARNCLFLEGGPVSIGFTPSWLCMAFQLPDVDSEVRNISQEGGSQAERPARTAPLVPGIGSQNGLRGLDKAAGLAACLGREGGAPISPFCLPALHVCGFTPTRLASRVIGGTPLAARNYLYFYFA